MHLTVASRFFLQSIIVKLRACNFPFLKEGNFLHMCHMLQIIETVLSSLLGKRDRNFLVNLPFSYQVPYHFQSSVVLHCTTSCNFLSIFISYVHYSFCHLFLSYQS